MPGLPLNVYALVRERIVDVLSALAREGALPEGLDLRHVEVSPPREATSPATRRWCWPSRPK